MRALIGLGANLGDPVRTLRAARDAIALLGSVTGVSSLYRTPAWGVRDQPPFVNAALILETQRTPRVLLGELQRIERDLGRLPTYRWGPRVLDLDILAIDGIALADPDLTIPHARLFERAFALVPLAEIDAAFAAARDALPEQDVRAVERIGPFDDEGASQ